MKEAIAILAACGLFTGAYVLIIALCQSAGKPTPKPGRDYDERGPYDVWSEEEKRDAEDNWAK